MTLNILFRQQNNSLEFFFPCKSPEGYKQDFIRIAVAWLVSVVEMATVLVKLFYFFLLGAIITTELFFTV